MPKLDSLTLLKWKLSLATSAPGFLPAAKPSGLWILRVVVVVVVVVVLLLVLVLDNIEIL